MEIPAAVVDQLRNLEQSLLDPKIRRSLDVVDRLLAARFVEFGSSGRVYDKQAMLTALAAETPSTLRMSHYEVRVLGADALLATYQTLRLDDAGRPVSRSLRSSVWQQLDGRWQLVFHQGTPAPLEGNA